MPETPTTEPLIAVAGDTIKFKKTWSDYPTATWTLAYTLHSRTSDASTATATVTEDGEDYIVTFSATDTAALTAGEYSLHGRITDGSESYSVYDGRLELRTNIAAAGATDDLRTFAAKALAAIETALLTNLAADFVTFAVDGQNFTRMPREEAMTMRDRLKAEVVREQRADKIRQGIGIDRNVYTRFS